MLVADIKADTLLGASLAKRHPGASVPLFPIPPFPSAHRGTSSHPRFSAFLTHVRGKTSGGDLAAGIGEFDIDFSNTRE